MRSETVIRSVVVLFLTTVTANGQTTRLHPIHEYGGEGLLYQPEVVVEAPGGEVYVLDAGNHRICVFDRE